MNVNANPPTDLPTSYKNAPTHIVTAGGVFGHWEVILFRIIDDLD